MIIFIIILTVSFLLYLHYEPSMEKIENGDWIMWYNNHENTITKRNFILIKKEINMSRWILRIENRELYTQFLSNLITIDEIRKLYLQNNKK